MSFSITCIHCQAVLKSPKPVPAGKNVKCPKCQQAFVVGAEPKAAPVAASSFAEDDEMAAAIAKLEAEQSATKAPPAAPTPAPPPKPPKISVPEVEVAEIDEEPDFVEAEVDEAAAPPGKKKSRRDEEEDEPAPAKKSRRRDEEEDEPPPAKKSRRRDEEDEDDRPRSKRRRDKDEEDDETVDKQPKKKKGGSMLLIVGLLGGFVALLMCGGCGVGGYLLIDRFSSPDIVGKWESTDIVKSSFEFRADRTGTLHSIIKADFRYRQDRDKLMISAVLGNVAIGGFGADIRGREVVYTVRREGDFLIMHEDAKGKEARLRKVQ